MKQGYKLYRIKKTINYFIENIQNIKFYNISYRSYIAIKNNCIIMIYPFVINIYKINTNVDNISDYINNYHFLKNCTEIEEILYAHHIDFLDKKINFDPCLIYELVSGYKIHTKNENDIVNSKEFYKQNLSIFINHFNRKQKLKKLMK